MTDLDIYLSAQMSKTVVDSNYANQWNMMLFRGISNEWCDWLWGKFCLIKIHNLIFNCWSDLCTSNSIQFISRTLVFMPKWIDRLHTILFLSEGCYYYRVLVQEFYIEGSNIFAGSCWHNVKVQNVYHTNLGVQGVEWLVYKYNGVGLLLVDLVCWSRFSLQ